MTPEQAADSVRDAVALTTEALTCEHLSTLQDLAADLLRLRPGETNEDYAERVIELVCFQAAVASAFVKALSRAHAREHGGDDDPVALLQAFALGLEARWSEP